jgi:ATP-binding cassette subfamily C protein
MLILDEATTALDPETEAAICGRMRHLAGEITILAISHQPAMREAADIVYRIEGGMLSPDQPQTGKAGIGSATMRARAVSTGGSDPLAIKDQ